jgi:hypothetical protein
MLYDHKPLRSFPDKPSSVAEKLQDLQYHKLKTMYVTVTKKERRKRISVYNK